MDHTPSQIPRHKALIEGLPATLDDVLSEARYLEQSQGVREAITLLEQAITHTEHSSLRLALATLQMRARSWKRALGALAPLLQRTPTPQAALLLALRGLLSSWATRIAPSPGWSAPRSPGRPLRSSTTCASSWRDDAPSASAARRPSDIALDPSQNLRVPDTLYGDDTEHSRLTDHERHALLAQAAVAASKRGAAPPPPPPLV